MQIPTPRRRRCTPATALARRCSTALSSAAMARRDSKLVTRLGDRLGSRSRATVTLVESARTHLWQPLFHAVAAGSIDAGEYGVNHLAQAHWHGFSYRFGETIGFDRTSQEVHLASTFKEVTTEGLALVDGSFVASELVVWAAGVKAPEVLGRLHGLETHRINQLVVEPTLQTPRDPAIFAIGDYAACLRPGATTPVLSRAQAAHQEVALMVRQIERLRGQKLRPYTYRDFGSLVSLGKWTNVGNLMGFSFVRNIFIEGLLARMMYRALCIMHEQALGGTRRAVLNLLTRALAHRTEPPVKLH